MTITPEMCGKAKPDVIQRMMLTDGRVRCYPAIKFPGRKDSVALSDDAGIIEAKSYDDALKQAKAVIARWKKELRAKKAGR